jgi:filamentous hemagglutinin family protein
MLFSWMSGGFYKPACAQLLPDRTLDSESSRITATQVNGLPADRIDGGAMRGSNLFHSFNEFNVEAGQRVYFSNPIGVNTIFSRVTGNHTSTIAGTLGVDGNASLFLLNPNGILFGPHAQLDIRGSFVASTSDRLVFADGQVFSATQPQLPPLLTINVPTGLQSGTQSNSPLNLPSGIQVSSPTQGTISNEARLAVGQDFVLTAHDLDLHGELQAGRNLTLHAQNTVRMRDRSTQPFRAIALGQMFVQGDQAIDIWALSHPESGLMAGGDLVLRSPQPVTGDAHYWSGGNFRIEQSDGRLGQLSSPHDPVIYAQGDVSFDSYIGASLHIIAAGRVTIPGAIKLEEADRENGLIDAIALSNGTVVNVNGQREPTLDIRAGVDPEAIAGDGVNGFGIFVAPPLPPGFPNLSSELTDAAIHVGTVFFTDPTDQPVAGRVVITNQFRPNRALSGDITVGSLVLQSSGSGQTIAIDARNNLNVQGILAADAPQRSTGRGVVYDRDGGNITLLARGDLTLAPHSEPQSGELSTALASISSIGLRGGSITLNSGGQFAATNGFIFSQSTGDQVGGRGGDLAIAARTVSLESGSIFFTNTIGRVGAGDVRITAQEAVTLGGPTTSAGNTFAATGILVPPEQRSLGSSGNIFIDAGSLTIRNGALLATTTNGSQNAGNITLRVSGATQLTGAESTITTAVASRATGNGGDITIAANTVALQDGATLRTSTVGRGNAGAINLDVSDRLTVAGLPAGQSPAPFENGITAQVLCARWQWWTR